MKTFFGLPTRQGILATLAALVLASGSSPGATPWGRDYFPNLPLTTQDGKEVRFFDDLIEGKIVVINFIYTSCPDTCPLETAQLVKVQEILGDRLGKDVFFYSITLDPKIDTPEVLKAYREKFHARWTFLTGDSADIWTLQKKLGLFLEEIRDGLNNHNVNMIIGNQATGRWMKRSPHENPYVLADQIGNWLDGWKRPPQLDNYENAPKLRELPRGEQLYRTRCASCHTVTGQQPKNALGPDLLGVTHRRETEWLLNWLRAPDQMLRDKDPIAIALYEQYNKLAMPNLRLNQQEATDLLDYLEQETQRIVEEGPGSPPHPATIVQTAAPTPDAHPAGPEGRLVEVTKTWIRQAHPAARVNAGYMTLTNPGTQEVILTGASSEAFGAVSMLELAKVDGSMKRRTLADLVIPAGGHVEFKPGGLHFLLKDRRRSLPAGEELKLTLLFRSGIQQTVVARVAEATP